MSSSYESSCKDADVSYERPGNGAGDCRFEILCQAATAPEPRKSTFDDPSAGQNFEALRGVGTFDDFYRPFADALQRLAQFISGIATIGKDMAQPGIARADRSKDARGAIAILNAGFVHDEPDQIALGVGDDVALAALDLLACVKAPWTAAFRGFHRLAVNHSRRRARLSASSLACRHDKRVVQRGKDSTTRPRVEIALHRRVGWEVLGQLPPLATGGRNVEDRIYHRSHVCCTWTPER